MDVMYSKEEKYDEARAVYKDISVKNLDWPEAIFDAWVSFEHLHGSVFQLQTCLARVERAQNGVNARRAKVVCLCLDFLELLLN